MKFKNIIGNQQVKEYLNKSLKNNNILQAYLFLGTEGIGKRLIAKEFAKNILCENTNEETCTCKSCVCFDSGNHTDFTAINFEGETIKIEQIRNMISKAVEKPILSKRKIYIINDADKMTKEAQNCLLKTLEEPPEYISIILIASNENMILNTIKSRCMKIKFKNIPKEALKKFALEIVGYENLTENMLEAFGGSLEKVIKLKENSDKYLEIENLVKDLSKNDIIDIMLNAKMLYNKENIEDILDYLIVCVYELSKENIKYLNCIEHINLCKIKLAGNANLDMNIDTLLLKMWEEVK